MFGWSKKNDEPERLTTHQGGSHEPPPPKPEPSGDQEELEDFVVAFSKPFLVDLATGLPALPDGWAWELRDVTYEWTPGPWGLFVVDESTGRSALQAYLDDRPSVHTLRGECVTLLKDAREALLERRNQAPLGKYPPHSVAK